MHASHPNPVPEDVGCLVIARDHLQGGFRRYDCTVWGGGKASFRSMDLPFVPAPQDLFSDLNRHVSQWRPIHPVSKAL